MPSAHESRRTSLEPDVPEAMHRLHPPRTTSPRSTRTACAAALVLILLCACSICACDDGGARGGDAGRDVLLDTPDIVADMAADDGIEDDGRVCRDGATRPAGDGCNSCTCLDGEWACSQRSCEQISECPQPGSFDGDDPACTETVVFAQNPTTSACCRYTNLCAPPSDWQHFFSLHQCEGACRPGAVRRADDGCNLCACSNSGEWECTSLDCADGARCEDDGDCIISGCHEEVCAAEEVETSCDVLSEEAACFAEHADQCGCVDNRCAWRQTEVLSTCVSNVLVCKEGALRAANDGCNVCRCDATGDWVCSEKSCGLCPAPRNAGDPCEGGAVWARDPSTGACCKYRSRCEAPRSWPTHESESACEASARECAPGESRLAPDGCNTCHCGEDGTWTCTDKNCEPPVCETDADCAATGCHGQVCDAEPRETSCKWSSSYACYSSPFTSCRCDDGVCAWRRSDALDRCLAFTGP